MPENKSEIRRPTAVILNPETEEVIGMISLVGDPVPPTEWINASGPLQGFVIIDGREELKESWTYQEEVLLRNNRWQRSIKLITYPTEGEDQGFLDFTSDYVASPKLSPEVKTKLLTQRGFAFLQSIFGT